MKTMSTFEYILLLCHIICVCVSHFWLPEYVVCSMSDVISYFVKGRGQRRISV